MYTVIAAGGRRALKEKRKWAKKDNKEQVNEDCGDDTLPHDISSILSENIRIKWSLNQRYEIVQLTYLDIESIGLVKTIILER